MALLTQVLTRAGYRVIPAYGGEDAIRKVKAGGIDLVVTDLAMPKVTGIEVIQTIKSDPATQHIPVIAVTA
ncbi:MAG: response regulator, partial [Candidatus Binatia bacterium]